jgi:hypothetical protein
MKCLRSEELFSDYLEESLPIPLRLDLEDHLGSCPECASLMAAFRDVTEALGTLTGPEPSPDLEERILAATRGELGVKQDESPSFPGFALPARINWAVWAAAAAFVIVLVMRPPAVLSGIGGQVNRMGHQTYSFGLRVYRGSERLIDELNVLRMTVGVAFEDRLDRLNERLKDLEEARRKQDSQPEETSTLVSPFKLTRTDARSKFTHPRSLL